jgi:hypothetical protein
MKKIGITTTVSIALLCLFLCTPALADYNFDGWPVETGVNGTVNGGVFIDYEPWDGERTLTGNFEVPNGSVKWACLYTGVWGTTETSEGWVNVTFNGIADRNGLGPIHLQGENDTNPNVWCTTHGKHWMFYNVTDLVNAGSTNTATTSKINATVGGFDGRVYGIVLVVVYEGGDNPKELQYWINDGHDALRYAYATWPPVVHDAGTTDFAGTVDTCNVTSANLTVVHLTAYEDSDTCIKGCCDKCLKFNAQELNTSMIDTNTFELNLWDVTKYVNSLDNTAWYTRVDDDCCDNFISVTNAILVLEITRDGPFDTGSSVNPYPSISGTHNGTIEVEHNITINAMYTYSCPGTGGHTELVKIWNETTGDCAEAHWDGYNGDYHNISFNRALTLQKGVIYNYTIQTGSYPQIHHLEEVTVGCATIRCTKFTDANGQEYDCWIPAFKLY